MKNLFNTIYLSVLFLFSVAGYAQLYPVQLTPIFNSPYSIKLSDYATSMDTKMQLLINPNDISISQRQVRLKFYIQGNGLNIQSSDYIQGQRPIFINGGELQTLTNIDIAALFRLENLQGMTPQQYANGLPEGMYNFCFEMYDYITNQKISQKSCASLYLILNDPPLLNTPQRNEQIAATDFPNILFTWTPRQINATNISYKFELKQLIDPTLDPQFGFQMSPILYEETLFGTALLYNLSMPILTPGMRYAWRVRAISTTGLSENAIFKNDGYSEIYSFKYTASCAAPTFLLSEAQNSKSVKITWEGVPEHTRYQVQYKKQDVRNAQWFSSNSLNTQSLITNLEPGITYQFRVGSSCDPAADGVQSFTYSGISTFTTPTETNGVKAYNCGITPKIDIQNQKPLTNLIQSETFTAGDFPVTILELKGENSPYSGRGYIVVPYLGDTKIAVEFNSIVINTDYQLISGIVETSYNPDWKNVGDVEDFTGEGEGGQIEETVPFIIKDIVINANGDIVVNGKDGEQVTIPGGKDTVITDSGGVDENGNEILPKVYNVDKEGNGSNEGNEFAQGGKSTPENTDGVDKSGQVTAFTAKGIKIAFSLADDSKYAFDVMPNEAPAALEKLYKKVDNVALPYKAVLNGYTDTMLATITATDANIKLDDIVFKTQNGAKIKADRKDNIFVLTVKGNLSYAEEQILATIKQGDKWKVIGAFMLVHISPKNVNVALVPTYNISKSKVDAIIASTQSIYDKVGIKFNFIKEDVLDITTVISKDVDKIQTEKNTLTSTYSSEQQRINDLYHGSAFNYVLFITDKIASTNVQGYMRLNGQFGYVFNSANDKTPAHELGHGIFKLEHPSEQYKTKDSSTDLLMDNSLGKVLNHQDWKQINDPAFKLYAFQSQASGGLAENIALSEKISKGIDFQKLITWMRDNSGKTILFDYTNFLTKDFELIGSGLGVPQTLHIDRDFEFDSDGVKKKLNFKGTLSTRKENITLAVENSPIGLNIDFGKSLITYDFRYLYDKVIENQDNVAISLKTNQILDYDALLGLLKYSIGETGSKAKQYVVDKFDKAFQTAGTDCNKIDFLYADAPNFIISARGNDKLWTDLQALSKCSIHYLGTNENNSVLNILTNIDSKWIFSKQANNINFFADLFTKLNSDYRPQYIRALSQIGLKNWSVDEINNCQFFLMSPYRIDGFLDQLSYSTITSWCEDNTANTKYEIGYTGNSFEKAALASSSKKIVSLGEIEKNDPVHIRLGENDYLMPAFIAYVLTKETVIDARNIAINNALSVLLPEFERLSLNKLKWLDEGEAVVKGAGSLFSKLDDLGLITLKTEINLLDEVTKAKFLNEFAVASDDALRAMNENSSLVNYWKTNGSFIKNNTYPNVGHKVWDDTKNAIITKANPTETKILNAIENKLSTQPLTNNKPVMAGAYCEEIGGDVIVKYNLSPSEKASFSYNNLDPIIKEHITYLNFIRQDAINGGKLYEKLYVGVSRDKLIAAGEAGSHAEILALDEVVKNMRIKGKFNSRSDLSKIQILVKGKNEWGNMCRCPHCYQLSKGVKMIGNE